MPSAPTERKLAAILSADVVGYSRLMAEDEEETVRRLGAYRTEITNLVGDHRGRVVDFTGDNFLAEFPTATDAVEAAAEIQRVLKARNAAVPAGREMEFRIGVHLGEVRVEGDRIYGDGVNIAARLERLAEPGGTCISAQVLDQVRRKLEFEFEDLGERPVKNIPDPVHAYHLRERPTEVPLQHERRAPRTVMVSVAAVAVLAISFAVYLTMTGRRPHSTGAPLTSIAVLPFDDMSPAGDQAWLANGMAEELSEALSRTEALRVRARTSAFAFQGQDLETIGAKLKIGSAVEGSVRRSGDDLRITAQLIRVSDGSHLWAARYDRKLADVFAIQTEIASEIAEAIRGELGIEDEEEWACLRGQRYVPRDVRAYEFVRKGLDLFRLTKTEAGYREAGDYYLQALEIDPEYALAHALVGWTHMSLFILGYDRSDEQRSSARAAANRALELDDTNAPAQELLTYLSIWEGRFADAEHRLERALEVTPADSGLRARYAEVLAETGRLEKAIFQARRAVDLDPLVPERHVTLGKMYLLARQYNAAIESYERALEINPQEPFITDGPALAYHLSGNDAEAFELTVQRVPDELKTAYQRQYEAGGFEGMIQFTIERTVAQSGERCISDPVVEAHRFALIGEADPMYECIDEALARQAVLGLNLKVHPNWDPYRDDPRYTALLWGMGLEQ